MSQRAARKMTHAIHRVEHVEIVAPYTLALRFEDGTEQRIDFQPVLEASFRAASESTYFHAASLDKEGGTLDVAEWCRLRSGDAT